jgi:hypothetical protein
VKADGTASLNGGGKSQCGRFVDGAVRKRCDEIAKQLSQGECSHQPRGAASQTRSVS